MCLANVDVLTRTNIKRGYKAVFLGNDDFTYVPPVFHTIVLTNEWVRDTRDFVLTADNGQKYPTGFHVFATLKGAELYRTPTEVVIEVEVDEIVASGQQVIGSLYLENSDICVVAKRIKVIREIENVS